MASRDTPIVSYVPLPRPGGTTLILIRGQLGQITGLITTGNLVTITKSNWVYTVGYGKGDP